MPHYTKRGEVPHKRHTQFRKADGGLYSEQLVSTEGFSDVYSLIYHHHPPTVVSKIDEPIDVAPKVAQQKNMQHRCYNGFNVVAEDDFLKKNIIGVQVLRNGSLIMANRNYDFQIDFGRTINIEKKFKNYKAFFQKAVSDSTLNKYKRINLKFTKQVVCIK